jgi:hypothetical protein
MIGCFWACGEAAQQESWTHLMVAIEERDRKELGSQALPNNLTFFHEAPPPKDSTTSQWRYRLATKPLTHGPLGTIPDPNYHNRPNFFCFT